MRGRRKGGRAAGVIAMVLRDDEVADRLTGDRLDEILQEPLLWRVVAGVDHDHTLRGHDHERIGVVELADERVDVVRDLLELGFLSGDRLRRLRDHSEHQQQKNSYGRHDRLLQGGAPTKDDRINADHRKPRQRLAAIKSSSAFRARYRIAAAVRPRESGDPVYG